MKTESITLFATLPGGWFPLAAADSNKEKGIN
jgi:hypothetical protein